MRQERWRKTQAKKAEAVGEERSQIYAVNGYEITRQRGRSWCDVCGALYLRFLILEPIVLFNQFKVNHISIPNPVAGEEALEEKSRRF